MKNVKTISHNRYKLNVAVDDQNRAFFTWKNPDGCQIKPGGDIDYKTERTLRSRAKSFCNENNYTVYSDPLESEW